MTPVLGPDEDAGVLQANLWLFYIFVLSGYGAQGLGQSELKFQHQSECGLQHLCRCSIIQHQPLCMREGGSATAVASTKPCSVACMKEQSPAATVFLSCRALWLCTGRLAAAAWAAARWLSVESVVSVDRNYNAQGGCRPHKRPEGRALLIHPSTCLQASPLISPAPCQNHCDSP